MKKKYYGDDGWEQPNELQEFQDALKDFDKTEDDLKKSEFKEQLVEEPTYVDLLNMLNDCVGLLNQINIEDYLLETYANVLMNAENMLLAASTHYELKQREADNLLNAFEEALEEKIKTDKGSTNDEFST